MASLTFTIAEDDLSCAICLDNWINKDSRILSCQHTFCLVCLKKLAADKSKIICPLCKKKTHIPDGRVQNLNKNLFQARIKSVNKNICKNHEKEASLFCKEHNLGNLCSSCFEEDHLKCTITTIKREEENDNSIERVFELLDYKKSSLKSIFDKKRNDLITKIECEEKILEEKFSNAVKLLNKDFQQKKINKTSFEYIDNFIRYSNLINQKSDDFSKISSNVSNMLDTLLQLFQNLDKESKMETIFISELSKSLLLPFKRIKKENYDKTKYLITKHISYHTPSLLLECKSKQVNCWILEKFSLRNINVDHLGQFFEKFPFIRAISIKRFLDLKECISLFFSKLETSSNLLEEISIVDCELDENDGRIIGEFLTKLTNINTINLSMNKNISASFHHILNGLKSTGYNLTNIDFSSCDLNADICKTFAGSLVKWSHIKHIDLSFNSSMEDGFSIICTGLMKSSNHLSELNFSYCDLHSYQCDSLAKLLAKCTNIESINLASNLSMNYEYEKIIHSLMNSSASLKNINLSKTDFPMEVSDSLAKLLRKCSNLEIFNLENNPYNVYGLPKIYDGLCNSKDSLKEIRLSDVNSQEYIMPTFVFSKLEKIYLDSRIFNIDHLIGCLLPSKSENVLRVLNLSITDLFGERVKDDLQDFLEHCSNMEEIYLNFRKDETFNFYKSLYKSRDKLKILHVRSRLNPNSCKNLGSLLENCTKIELVCFFFGRTGGDNLQILFKGLEKSCKSLNSLKVWWDSLGKYGFAEVINLLKKCSNLEAISIPWHESLKNTLIALSSSLKKIEFVGYLYNEKYHILGEVLKKCSNIEVLILPEFPVNSIEILHEGLLKSKNSLKTVKFDLSFDKKTDFSYLRKLLEDLYYRGRQQFILNLTFGIKNHSIYHDIWEFYDPSTHFTWFFLANLSLNAEQCNDFRELLSVCNHIEEVRLNGTFSSNTVMQAVTEGLHNSREKLRKIYLVAMKINRESSAFIGSLLQKCSRLETVGLNNSVFQGNGIGTILMNLNNSTARLEVIFFYSCNLTVPDQEALGDLLLKCKKLKKITLSVNDLKKETFSKICLGLLSSKNTLEKVGFRECNLTDECFDSLNEMLKDCTNIKELLMTGNKCMQSSVVQISYTLKAFNKFLPVYNISDCDLNLEQKIEISRNIDPANLIGFTIADERVIRSDDLSDEQKKERFKLSIISDQKNTKSYKILEKTY